MIRLTDIDDAVSDATFSSFQLIVTHGLCKKTCPDCTSLNMSLQTVITHITTSCVWSRGTQYMHRLDLWWIVSTGHC